MSIASTMLAFLLVSGRRAEARSAEHGGPSGSSKVRNTRLESVYRHRVTRSRALLAAPRDGSLLGEVKELEVAVVGLALGTSRLDVASLVAGAIAPTEIAFAGADPKKLELGE